MGSFHHRSVLFIGVFVMLLNAVSSSAQDPLRVPTETTFRQIEASLSELEHSPDAKAATAPIAQAKRLLIEGRLQAAAGKLRAAGFTADRLDAMLTLITILEQNAATSDALRTAEKELTDSTHYLDELKSRLKTLREKASMSSAPTTDSVSEKEKEPPSEAGALP